MKKLYFVSFVVLVISIIFSGCRKNFIKPNVNTAPIRIAAVLPHKDYGYWTDVANGIMSAQDDFPVDIKISMPQLNYNISQMTELIKAATAARVDGIIVQGIDNDDYINSLKEASKAGIQVAFIDTDFPKFGKRLYVGTDNYAAGRLMGEKLVQLTNKKTKIAVISGAPLYRNMELRLTGLKDYISSYPNVEISRVDYGNYDSMTVMQKYKEICVLPFEIDSIVCLEGTGALALGNIVKTRDTHIRCILGFDYSDESIKGLNNGIIDGLILQRIHKMGYICVREIYNFKNTGKYSKNIIYTNADFITAVNLDQEGHYQYDK